MEGLAPELIVGVDLGSATASAAIYTPAKVLVGKPFDFPNQAEGFAFLHRKLTARAVCPAAILVGFEATGRLGEALYQFLVGQGDQVQLLHPVQTAEFARRRGRRAKTDWLDATTIARVLLSGEARPVYVPDEQIQTYRELVRVHTNLSDEAARYKLEIRDLVRALFPEFTQVFASGLAASPKSSGTLMRVCTSSAPRTGG